MKTKKKHQEEVEINPYGFWKCPLSKLMVGDEDAMEGRHASDGLFYGARELLRCSGCTAPCKGPTRIELVKPEEMEKMK